MDLLRLVLAQQPAAGLERFSHLIKSESFNRTWRALYRLKQPTQSEWRGRLSHVATVNGDINPGHPSDEHYPPNLLCHRAAFLQKPDIVREFIGRNTNWFDFWYLLSTGNRQIQELALQQVRKLPSRDLVSILTRLNDPGNFPWDDWLDDQILQLLDRIWASSEASNLKSATFKLFGTIGKVLNPVNFGSGSYYYYYYHYLEFLTLRVLGGEDSWEENPTIERALANRPDTALREVCVSVLISSGYLRYDPIFTEKFAIDDFVGDVVPRISHHGLTILAKSGIPITGMDHTNFEERIDECPVLTKRMVLQARLCLDDPVTRPLLTGEILEIYKLIAAQDDSKFNFSTLLQITGVPVSLDEDEIELEELGPDSWARESVQGSQMINPAWAYNIHLNGTFREIAADISFIRGQWDRRRMD